MTDSSQVESAELPPRIYKWSWHPEDPFTHRNRAVHSCPVRVPHRHQIVQWWSNYLCWHSCLPNIITNFFYRQLSLKSCRTQGCEAARVTFAGVKVTCGHGNSDHRYVTSLFALAYWFSSTCPYPDLPSDLQRAKAPGRTRAKEWGRLLPLKN